MKRNISEKGVIESFKEKLAVWLEEKGGLKSRNLKKLIKVEDFTEFSYYSISYNVEVESRSVVSFTRPDNKKIEGQPTITSIDQIDPWKYDSDKIKGFVNYKQLIDVNESLTGMICRKCQNVGELVCPECQEKKQIFCPVCRGSGKAPCPACKGRSRIPCQHCKGAGFFTNETSKTKDTCTECHGKGFIACSSCADGSQVCNVCKGEKKISCKKCEGRGRIACTGCEGKGQTIAGFSVDITFKPLKEKEELCDNEVPKALKNQLISSAGEWQTDLLLKNEDFEKGQEKLKDVPGYLLKSMEHMKAKISMPAGSRVVERQFSVEKKVFFRMDYSIKHIEHQAWFSGPDMKVFHEQNISATAHDAIRKAENREQVQKFLPYLSTTFAGSLLFSVVSVLWVKRLLAGSLHSGMFAYGSIIVNLAAGFFIGILLYFINLKKLDNMKKKMMGGIAAVFIVLLPLYAALPLFNFNPAKNLDAKKLQEEYTAHFPFGLRTLANNEDIEFLERLLKKYKPTGIDLDNIRKDIKWLRSKKRKDDYNMKQIEKTKKKMNTVKKKAPIKIKKRRSKLYIK